MKVLTTDAKSMIDNAIWDTYGVMWPEDGVTDSSFASSAYLQEKGISAQYTGKICTSGDRCNDKVNRTTSFRGLVGLMSVSDMTYANGWLYEQGDLNLYPCSISPYAFNGYSYRIWVAHDDYAELELAGHLYGVFPSVYLKSSVEIIDGNGNTEPYILKIA